MTKVIFEDETFTETKYDKLGRRIESIDPEGIITKYEYDDLGRLTAVVQTLNVGQPEEKEIRTEYKYDEAGRLIEVKDAEERVTKYEYDKAGRRRVIELPKEEGETQGKRALSTYDEVGNLKTYTDFNGEVTNYDYDAQNRLDLKNLEDDPDVSYIYTDDGQIETLTDSRGTTEFKYDEMGRLLWRKDPDGEHLANGNTIEYQYNDAGNVTEVKTKAGTIEYQYDEWNRLEKVIEGTETTTYFYNAIGNLERTEFPNGTVETRTYDELNRLQVLEVRDVNDVVLSKYEYELNDAGYREQVKETLLQPDGTTVERTIDYDYDELYRLLAAMIQGGETVEYAYDDVGNRISSTDALETREYVYDEHDRLTEEKVNGVAVVNYTYDNNGNLQTRTEGNETVNYVWDDQNRLVTVQTPTETINYVYDDDNIRVSQTIGTETTSYVLDKNRPYAQVLAEYTNGNLDASYLYGLDLISQERGGVDSYYLVDGLGSTRGLTDENGNVTDIYTYDAYGNLIDSVGSSENDYLFAGEQFDESLDQYYLRDRYYDPSVGRFTRRDTYEGRNFEPITLHKYLYANGNPINGIDPSGLFTLAEVSAARQVRDILAETQLSSYSELIRNTDSDGLGGKISGFIDGVIGLIETIKLIPQLPVLLGGAFSIVGNASWPKPKRSSPAHPDLPNRPHGSKEKTLGIFTTPSGQSGKLQSGYKGPGEALRNELGTFTNAENIALTHAEGHALGLMKEHGLSEAYIFINYKKGPCDFCKKGLPEVMKKTMNPGDRLVVRYPDGIGYFDSTGWHPQGKL